MSQDEESVKHIWVATTFIVILSNLGGYSTVITGTFALLLGNYQEFVFDKSMLKKLYFQETERHSQLDGDGQERDDDDEMIERINNRRKFWFGYMGYGLVSLTSKCCCCCKKYMLKHWRYYRKQWVSYKKFKRARDSLSMEKDVEFMIYNQRINKFLQKSLLMKRQRDVVQYFMRYLIEDHEIKPRSQIASR